MLPLMTHLQFPIPRKLSKYTLSDFGGAVQYNCVARNYCDRV